MVVVTSVLAGATINSLIRTGFDYISNKVKDRLTRSSMNDEVDKLKKGLPKIQAILSAAEKAGITLDEMDSGLAAWMWQLRDAVDAADNLLDDIEYRKLEKEFESDDEKRGVTEVQQDSELDIEGVKMCCTAFVSKCTMKNMKYALIDDPILVRLKEIVKQLDEVAACVGEFVQLVALLEQRASRHDKHAEIARDRETGFLPIEEILFGRVEEKEELIKWLLSSRSGEESKFKSNVSVLAIVGVGGIGKTSLAQDIYNDKNVNEYFSKRIWICVSNTFDVHTILGKIVQSSGQSLSILQEEVKKKLSGEKFLLVLDDVWDDENRDRWKKLVMPLQSGEYGSKIILTTRMGSVAKMARDVIEGSKHLEHNLKGLDNEMSSLILDKHAFAGVNRATYHHLQPIVIEITKRLGGVPLLLKAVGGVLNSYLDYGHWISILNSNAMNLKMNENKVVNVLKLSYQNLPIPLQNCFRFCSIFPEDYRYTKRELVAMWVALGMILQSQNGHIQPEDTGNEYFNILVRKSFLEDPMNGYYNIWVRKSFLENPQQLKRYVMHDCMHHIASIVSKGECLGVSNVILKEIPETIRHLFIKSKNVSTLADMCPPKNLQTLIMENLDMDEELPPTMSQFFKRLTNLHVLKLHWYGMHDLSAINADLYHLRYVDIYTKSRTLHRMPNYFEKLYHLQVLHLGLFGLRNAFADQNTPISGEISIQRSFLKLRKLRQFLIKNSNYDEWSPVFFPRIGRLTSLQEIDTFTLKDEDGYKLSELKNMNNLNSSLKITGLETVRNYEEAKDAKLNEKKRLCSLNLEWTSNDSSLGDNRRRESDTQLSDFMKPPCNVDALTIKGYEGLRLPCWVEIGCPKYLVSLSIIDCSGMSQLAPLGCFCFIKCLVLKNLPLLKQMPPLPLSLERLKISDVGLVSFPTLWLVSECTSLVASSSLFSLVIYDCPKLRSLADGLFQQQNRLTGLEYLEIGRCKNLARFPDIGLTGLISLKSLWIQCMRTPEIITSMPNTLLPLSLMSLTISGQIEGVLPNKGLTSLEKLSLIKLNVTPLSLENYWLKLVALEYIEISGCQELKSLEDLHVPASLKKLVIKKCSKLEVVAFQIEEDQGNTIALKELKISSCDELVSVDNLCVLTSLKSLVIKECPKLEVVAFQIEEVQRNTIALKELKRSSFDELVSMNNLCVVTSFESLVIEKCSKLEVVAFQIEEDQGRSVALREIKISSCDELVSVDNLCVPTSLKSLKIVDCPNLASIRWLNFDNTQGTLPSVANYSSIKNNYEIREFRNLKELDIWRCAALASLDFMFAIKSIHRLNIFECPKLLVGALEDLTTIDGQRFLTDEVNTLSVAEIYLDCASLLLLPPLRNITSVQHLTIDDCSQLLSLPEFFLLQNRTSLTCLELSHCSSLETLPDCLQDLTMLKKLDIWNVPKLQSLPELPSSLQTLSIRGCTSELEQLYENNTGENWSKIANISEVSISEG